MVHRDFHFVTNKMRNNLKVRCRTLTVVLREHWEWTVARCGTNPAVNSENVNATGEFGLCFYVFFRNPGFISIYANKPPTPSPTIINRSKRLRSDMEHIGTTDEPSR